MTKEQYIYILSYKPIINLFVNSGEFLGNCDELFEYYKFNFNGGNSVNTRCPSCIGAVLLHLNELITQYERNL